MSENNNVVDFPVDTSLEATEAAKEEGFDSPLHNADVPKASALFIHPDPRIVLDIPLEYATLEPISVSLGTARDLAVSLAAALNEAAAGA